MNTAIIGMGTNLGDRLDNLNRAVKALALLPRTRVLQASHLYETQPVGFLEQGPFLNANLMIETDLSPMALLGGCLGIEAAFGRERTIKNGPRVLDLDLLLYEGMRSDSFELTLPHPRILERAFVMIPMMDLYPAGRAPGLYFAPHLREIGSAGVQRFEAELAL